MPAAVDEKTATTFSAIVDAIEEFQEKNETVWYRGCGRPEFKLLPTLYRHPETNTQSELLEVERRISIIFSQKSPPFVPHQFNNVWDQMFFMQHYGVPTRLLDWTESPFIALYFALMSNNKLDFRDPQSDAIIWLLNPSAWNKASLSDIGFTGGIIDASQPQIKAFSPETDLAERKNIPVMIYGTHNSSRIVAQRGMFALFGKCQDPMEDQYKGAPFVDGTMSKIVIPKDSIFDVRNSILRKGITESAVFPDLHGLSMEITRSFGF
ncbi:FRG domain-containing protein [Novosphingobium sp. AAP83]|uniref:FRG domain-containing protein n=1 Tax=Novosphingobium sp. AAP83 TaxID=1523425 RepID=UPI0009EC5CEE|nr:FRG domain-containing protein [Novosphingobium sp. AAP83]